MNENSNITNNEETVSVNEESISVDENDQTCNFFIYIKNFIGFVYILYLVFINIFIPLFVIDTEKICNVPNMSEKYTIQIFSYFEKSIITITIAELIFRLSISIYNNDVLSLFSVWYKKRHFLGHFLVFFKIMLLFNISEYVFSNFKECDIFLKIQVPSKIAIIILDVFIKPIFIKRGYNDGYYEEENIIDHENGFMENIQEPERRIIIPNFNYHQIYLTKFCPICLDDYFDEESEETPDLISLVCGHLFHKSCVAEQTTCPLCRVYMPPEPPEPPDSKNENSNNIIENIIENNESVDENDSVSEII